MILADLSVTHAEFARQIGKPERTVKQMTVSLQEKGGIKLKESGSPGIEKQVPGLPDSLLPGKVNFGSAGLDQIILYNIHIDQPAAEEGDALRLLGCLDGDGKHLFSVIDKQFGAETV